MAKYDKIITDMGKGRQMLHRSVAKAVRVSGTVYALIDQIPAPFRIRRVLVGAAVLDAAPADLSAEVVALARGSDLDTAAAAGNRVITPIVDFTASVKLFDSDAIAVGSPGALTALGKGRFAKDTILVLQVADDSPEVGGDVSAVVEWDVVGTSYGAYDSGDDAAGAYE